MNLLLNLMLTYKRWVNEWKMQFNPDPKKQANEVILSSKLVSNNLQHINLS